MKYQRHAFSSFALIIGAFLLGGTSGIAQQEDADESLAAGAEALAADATLFPIPQYDGDFWTREALTGDWDGLRLSLAQDNGIQFSTEVNQFYQGIWDGGRNSITDYSGSADFRFKFDSGQAGLWPGGFLEIHGETYWGDSINRATGALLPVNTDTVLSQPGGNGTYLPHIVYTQFLAENFAVVFGKMDTTVGDSNRFAHGVGDKRFMNLGFSFNPVSLLTAPYSTLGAGIVWLPTDDTSLTLSAIDTDGTLTRSGFDTVFNGNTTVSAEFGVNTHFFEQPGRHLFTGNYSGKEFFSVAQDPRVFFPRADVAPRFEDDSWAFAYNFDQFVDSNPNDPSQGWGVFGRFGVSDGEANIIHRFYSLGLGGTGMIPRREGDRHGVGYYYMQLSDNRLGLLTDDDEHGVEIFYNMAVTPWFELTADLQVVDGAGRFSETAVIGGLRGRIVY